MPNSTGKLISGYRNLIVWQEAKSLAILIYQITSVFPKNEMYGLTSQMKRAAVSISANIAEGWLRKSTKDKLHYLEMAHGSLLELESEAEIAQSLHLFISNNYEKFDNQRARTSYLLFKYIEKIKIL